MSDTSREIALEEYDSLFSYVKTLVTRLDTLETDVISMKRTLAEVERVNESYEGFCLLQGKQTAATSQRQAIADEEEEEDEENLPIQHWCCWFCL